MKYTLLLLLGLLLVAGCGVEPGENLDRGNAIELRSVDISADADRAYLDRTITITAKCRPLLKGKGSVVLMGGGDYQDSSIWTVEWPVKDTVRGWEHERFPVVIPASFDPNNEFAQQWRIRLYPQAELGNRGYYFQALVSMDSIFLADSNRYFPIESVEAIRSSHNGRGFEPGAASTTLRLEKP